VLDFDRLSRQDLHLEDPEIPNWQFSGFNLPYELVQDTYRAYKNHGVLLVEGGYLDQPEAWWRDIRTCEALYNTRYDMNLPEARQKWEKDAR